MKRSESPGVAEFPSENPVRAGTFEIPDFEIPDLALPERKQSVTRGMSLKIEHSLIPDFEVVVELTRYETAPGRCLLSIEMAGHSLAATVFSFKDALFSKVPGYETNGQSHKYFSSSHRHVRRAYRGKGVGELMLGLRETFARKIGERYPELRGEWMDVVTDVSTVASLVVDQGWLKEHGLGDFAKRKGADLKYMPHPADEGRVETLLREGTTDMGQVSRGNEAPVVFIKRLVPEG